MTTNDPNLFRPLGAPTHVGEFDVGLRPGALRCVRCGRHLLQHDAQEFEGGIRFACSSCGLDAMKLTGVSA
jgi:hypothetical protein